MHLKPRRSLFQSISEIGASPRSNDSCPALSSGEPLLANQRLFFSRNDGIYNLHNTRACVMPDLTDEEMEAEGI
jgi:hypothetical protein